MATTRLDLAIIDGDSLTLQVTVVDASGTPIDLTSATVTGRIGSSDDPDLLDATVSVIDAAAGRVDLTYADTSALAADWQYVHQVRYTAGSVTKTIITGLIRVGLSLYEA